MGNIESLIFMQYICEYDENYYNKYEKTYSIKKQHKYKNNIHNCHICNKNLSNKTIYRSNDLSFCSIKHRDSQNELKI